MRRRMWIIGVLAGVLALTATAAQAVPPGQAGRVDRTAYQLGNPALGAVHVAVAGELVNTDADADADALRGAVRMTKGQFALRVQTQSELHRILGGAWVTCRPRAGGQFRYRVQRVVQDAPGAVL